MPVAGVGGWPRPRLRERFWEDKIPDQQFPAGFKILPAGGSEATRETRQQDHQLRRGTDTTYAFRPD